MVVLVILEFLIVDRKKYAFNDTITSINTGIFSLLVKYVKKMIFWQKCTILFRYGGKTITTFIYSSIYPHVKLLDLDPQSINTFVFCFLAADLSYYLAHRFIHGNSFTFSIKEYFLFSLECGIFWSFHQVHHSSSYFNFGTGLRKGALSVYFIAFSENFPYQTLTGKKFLFVRWISV